MDENLKLSGHGDSFLFPRRPCGEPKGESAASAARVSPANCLFYSFWGKDTVREHIVLISFRSV